MTRYLAMDGSPAAEHPCRAPLRRTMASVDVELLVVPDCPNEAGAAALVRGVLDQLGMAGTAVRTTIIDTDDDAQRRGFTGSPTILVNGADPFIEPDRPAAMACRVYRTRAGVSGLPDPLALRQALSDAASS